MARGLLHYATWHHATWHHLKTSEVFETSEVFVLALGCVKKPGFSKKPGFWLLGSLRVLRPTLRHVLTIAIHRPGQRDFPLKLREIETESFLLANSEIG